MSLGQSLLHTPFSPQEISTNLPYAIPGFPFRKERNCDTQGREITQKSLGKSVKKVETWGSSADTSEAILFSLFAPSHYRRSVTQPVSPCRNTSHYESAATSQKSHPSSSYPILYIFCPEILLQSVHCPSYLDWSPLILSCSPAVTVPATKHMSSCLLSSEAPLWVTITDNKRSKVLTEIHLI